MKKGFTLIELLVVIAIIGILALLIILNLSNASERAKFSKIKSELRTVNDAATIAYADGEVKPMVGVPSWRRLSDSSDGNINNANQYGYKRLLDNKGESILLALPQVPTGTGWGDSYMIYLNGASDHAAALDTPSGDPDYCINKGGTAYKGTVATSTGSYNACEAE